MDNFQIKTSVLASGSKGNCVYIETLNNHILVDIGTTSLYVEKKLKDINVEPSLIDSIFITHTHVDHVAGLKVFLKKYNPTLYLTKIMYSELKKDISIKNYVIIDSDELLLNDIIVKIIKTSHDANDSNGYIFEYNNKKMCYITDTGYINKKYFKLLKNCDIYIMESNHDIEILMNGKYPYHLKQRIISDTGHLSNKDTSYYLSKLSGDNTKYIVLTHLSEENNDPEVALNTLKETLEQNNKKIDNLIISKQKERTELIGV